MKLEGGTVAPKLQPAVYASIGRRLNRAWSEGIEYLSPIDKSKAALSIADRAVDLLTSWTIESNSTTKTQSRKGAARTPL
jgi:hypothetical protein